MARVKTVPRDPSTVVGYIRVSSTEQADSGLGLAAQRATIEAECSRRGWNLTAIHQDAGLSGKAVSNRPGLADALKDVETGVAGGLIVSKLDRLSRSLKDFAELMERAQKRGWNLVACDLGIDLSTPAGEFMANVMGSAAQWERKLIGLRTKEALAAKRATGVRLGRPRILADAVVTRICVDHRTGLSLSSIARALNADGVPTAHGGSRWHASTVSAVINSRSTPREQSLA
jgi:DNA invertase Pin-like site-specific DNA recombinase